MLDAHQHVVPGEIARSRVVIVRLLPVCFVGAVLNRRVINDEVEVGIAQRRLLDVFRIGQMAERARLIRVAFVHADGPQAELA